MKSKAISGLLVSLILVSLYVAHQTTQQTALPDKTNYESTNQKANHTTIPTLNPVQNQSNAITKPSNSEEDIYSFYMQNKPAKNTIHDSSNDKITATKLIICSQPFLIYVENLPNTLNFSFYIDIPSERIVLDDVTVSMGNEILIPLSITYNETIQLFDISVNLPAVEPGKYMLKMRYCSLESVNFKAVNVYQDKGNFKFIHLTDLHYNPPWSGFENQLNYTLRLIQKINPDFIIFTGDMHSSPQNYERFYSILQAMDFSIPIFFVNGNHEKSSLFNLRNTVLFMGTYNCAIGIEYPVTFTYGNYSFVGFDSTNQIPYGLEGNISDSQFQWLENELKSNQNKHLITFCHHPLYFDRQPNLGWVNSSLPLKIIALMSSTGVLANFAGHLHKSDLSILDNVTYYTTVSSHNRTHASDNKPFPPAGFRTVEVIDDAIVTACITSTFSYYTGELVEENAMSHGK